MAEPSDQAVPETTTHEAVQDRSSRESASRRSALGIYDLLLILVLIVGAYFRTIGLNWDSSQHLHPDERFLTMVENSLMPPSTPSAELGLPPTQETQPWRAAYADSLRDCTEWGGYFDTACSPLNPNNRGYTFYVYGNLPILAVRYLAEGLNEVSAWAAGLLAAGSVSGPVASVLTTLAESPDWVSYDGVTLLGRQVSALADLLTIILMYLTASRLYGRKVALLTAAFSALAVLQIQISHFFTVETATNLFMFAGLYFAVRIATGAWQPDYSVVAGQGARRYLAHLKIFLRDPLLWAAIGFGVAQGAAMASKISAAPEALLLPAAFGILYARMRERHARQTRADEVGGTQSEDEPAGRSFDPIWLILSLLVIGGAACILAFRIFQPYAFVGLQPNPAWIDQIRAQRAQASGEVDFPPALQWANRSILFGGINLALWGLGIPFAALALIGYLWMGWRIVRGEWKEHLLLWGWTGFFFVWQSLQMNPTMRYFMPVYPLAAMMAAWFLVMLAHTRVALQPQRDGGSRSFSLKGLAIALGVVAVTLTATWAFAFTRIYSRPHTRVAATEWIYQNVPAAFTIPIDTEDGETTSQQLSFPYRGLLQPGAAYRTAFIARESGSVDSVRIQNAVDPLYAPLPQTLTVSLAEELEPAPWAVLARGQLSSDFETYSDPRGESYTVTFDAPAQLEEGKVYYLNAEVSDGALQISGSAPVLESSWDDPLPLRMADYDPYGGLYQDGLNQELYWDDNLEKLERLLSTLNQGDYIFLSSNRQWGTIPRVPERYPLTAAYYRALIGCPPEREVMWCYNVAKPGQFEGQLGFDLVEVFESFPTLGEWQFNDQFAEEAFTVYDHPKVLIFKKASDYDPARVREVLEAVDTGSAIHVLPGQLNSRPADLMLPEADRARQRDGGTWSVLFDVDALQNRYPYLGVVLWYLTIFALGLFIYPLLSLILPGLRDRGYPLARLSGLLIWSYLAWLAGSAGIAYSRQNIGLILLGIALVGAALAWFQRRELSQQLRKNWRYLLVAEGLFLGFFVLDLLIRLGNPDLWHPAKGGERPMDFSYLNAVIKSTTFPPYDPWFAGGYINYYYYGFVLAATPIKFLGIVPSVAYNMVLPTLYAMLAMGGFSLVWNLVSGGPAPPRLPANAASFGGEPSEAGASQRGDVRVFRRLFSHRFWAAFAAAAALVLLGNLGIPRMVYQGFVRLGAPNEQAVPASNAFERALWAAQGLVKTVGGERLPYGPGDWYWNPSRVIPGGSDIEPITEFPLFTFLYSDLHAHMLALPLTLLALSWALSVLLARARWPNFWARLASFAFGGLVIGSLRPTNTWDLPTYLVIGCIAVIYAVWRYAEVERVSLRLLEAVGWAALLVGLSLLLYQPFTSWYAQAYGAIDLWRGSRTPLTSYFIQWGLFLFAILSWMTWETREWLATTPVSALNRLRPFVAYILAALVALLLLVVVLLFVDVSVSLLALPLAAWAAILLFRPGLPDAKRAVLFIVGTGLFLTVLVDVVVLRGDIGRMNTVFKFYLQVWVLLGMSAAASVGWLLPELDRWTPGWRAAWETIGVVLLAGASMFMLMGGMDKIRDRWVPEAPHTLDSMAYMRHAQYFDQGVNLDLKADYEAIRWMQENVRGSPPIVEANCVEYHWCSRFTIYTGLPGVLGWNWHQRQQRAAVADGLGGLWVTHRQEEIASFYLTTDPGAAKDFLDRYAVEYIILGGLERAYYPGSGLEKFAAQEGILWDEVYDDAGTQIYKVK
jgi:YYY domain-containing protein